MISIMGMGMEEVMLGCLIIGCTLNQVTVWAVIDKSFQECNITIILNYSSWNLLEIMELIN